MICSSKGVQDTTIQCATEPARSWASRIFLWLNIGMIDTESTVAQYQNNEVETDPIVKLVEVLNSVDTNDPEAQLNAISISDGQGGRIYF